MIKKISFDFRRVKGLFTKNETLIAAAGILFLIFLVIIVLFIPKSFSAIQPIKSVNFFSKNTNYSEKEPGAWKVTKSTDWLAKGIVEVNYDVDTIIKEGNKDTDILLVMDTSSSMTGDKLTIAKEAVVDLIDSLISSDKNRLGLITFNNTSELQANFTNNRDLLIEKVNSLVANGSDNYYRALECVNAVLKNYQSEDNRECLVLFLTSAKPSLDIPNEEAYYEYLKEQYPNVKFNGIQYEMGNVLTEAIKSVSDKQYVASRETLSDVLTDASLTSIAYEEFQIKDYLDSNYFLVESSNINVNKGKITFDSVSQIITWDIAGLKVGSKAKMTIKAKLKDEVEGEVYPISTKEEITSKIDEEVEAITSSETPNVSNNYRVIYDGDSSLGCSVENVPTTETKKVLETVGISGTIPKCSGYQFRGWKLVTKGVTKLNDDFFLMPESDVVFRATWSKLSLNKTMDGEVSTVGDIEKGEIILDLTKKPTETLDISGVTNVTYEILDGSIVSVDDEGQLIGKSVGSTIVTVRGDDDYLKKYKVTVQQTVTVTYEKQGVGVTGITKTSDSCVINTNGGSCKVVSPRMTVASGYEAIGWNSDREAISGVVPGNIIILSSNMTYYTIFYKEAATYTVKFEANGNTISETKKSCSTERVYNGTAEGVSCSIITPTITAPSATPIVVGYNQERSATTAQIGSNVGLTLDEFNTGKTYYAITKKDAVTRTTTYLKQGTGVTAIGKTSDRCTIAATYNGKIQENSCSVVAPTITVDSGYTAVGWNFDKDATSGISVGDTITLSANAIYYSISYKNAVTYIANFNANGNEVNSTSKSCTIVATYNTVAQATSCTVITPTITAPSATPTVVGYSQERSATTSQVGSNASLALSSVNTGKTYYAITKKDAVTRTATYLKQGTGVTAIGKTNDSCTIAATYNGEVQGNSCSVVAPTITVDSGYTAVGWNFDKDATSGISVGDTITLSANAIYYSISYKNAVTYTVNFGDNGNTILDVKKSCTLEKVYNSVTQATSCTVTTPAIMAPSATPTVVGYNQDRSATTSQVGSNASLTVDSSNNGNTYYAITKKSGFRYAVNFNANGNTIAATSKSCSIADAYNGAAQGTSCNIVTPVITAPSATPTVIGYNQTASATTSQVGSNATLTVNSSNQGKTYYAITRKDAVTRTMTYTKGNGVSATGKSSDSCTIAATYNGTSQGTSCSITLTTITAGTGYTSPTFNSNSSGTGTSYSASSSYILSGNVTLYAIAKRNFTCAARRSTTSYAGKNWYTWENDGNYCYLVLNQISSSTGTYAERTSKLTNEYFTSGSVLLAEKNAGLVSNITSYGGNEGVSTASVWWDEGGGVMSNRTFPQYFPKYTLMNIGSTHANLGGDISMVADGFMGTVKDSITSYQTSTTNSCDSVSGANCVIYNGTVSGSVSNHGSTSFSRFSFPSTSEGSTTSFKISHKNYPSKNNYSFSQYVLYIKTCGGTYHNSNIYKMTAKSKTQVTHYNYSNQNTSTINKKNHTWDISGVASSTTESVTNGTKRVYNTGSHSSCVPIYNYTFGNGTYPIHYRLFIKVKM